MAFPRHMRQVTIEKHMEKFTERETKCRSKCRGHQKLDGGSKPDRRRNVSRSRANRKQLKRFLKIGLTNEHAFRSQLANCAAGHQAGLHGHAPVAAVVRKSK